jgi:hypothetical protein
VTLQTQQHNIVVVQSGQVGRQFWQRRVQSVGINGAIMVTTTNQSTLPENNMQLQHSEAAKRVKVRSDCASQALVNQHTITTDNNNNKVTTS